MSIFKLLLFDIYDIMVNMKELAERFGYSLQFDYCYIKLVSYEYTTPTQWGGLQYTIGGIIRYPSEKILWKYKTLFGEQYEQYMASQSTLNGLYMNPYKTSSSAPGGWGSGLSSGMALLQQKQAVQQGAKNNNEQTS